MKIFATIGVLCAAGAIVACGTPGYNFDTSYIKTQLSAKFPPSTFRVVFGPLESHQIALRARAAANPMEDLASYKRAERSAAFEMASGFLRSTGRCSREIVPVDLDLAHFDKSLDTMILVQCIN